MTDSVWPDFSGLDFGALDLGQSLDELEEGRDAPDPEPPAKLPDVELDHQGRPRRGERGGRPTKYTSPRVVAILAALWGGATRAEAARKAGVSPAAFYAWLQLGRAGHPTFAPL